ncbi:hypothetical protein SALBM311S_07737 [Streptomyces alboniger]
MSRRIATRRVALYFSRVKGLAMHNMAVHRTLLPSWRESGAAKARYLRRSYHPSREGLLGRTVTYPGPSGAARAGT